MNIETLGTSPVTVAEAKRHLRVDGHYEDDLIQQYIDAAVMHCETFTGLCFVDKRVTHLHQGNKEVHLPYSPILEVESVVDIDAAIVPYKYFAGAVPAVLYLEEDTEVQVVYQAKALSLSPDIKTAILMIVHQLYEQRGSADGDKNQYIGTYFTSAADRVNEAYLRRYRVHKGMA